MQTLHCRIMTALNLTPEQRAVVAHDLGPALVFAVAGAGKTTAMVHRIERLVREGIFRPERILATSFSKATVKDIEQALSPWVHCQNVKVNTLHALGLSILHQAKELQCIPPFTIAGEKGMYSEKGLLKQVLGLARRRQIDVPSSFDEQDFLNYVGMCKGNFQFPSTEDLDLPEISHDLVQAAEAPEELPEYVQLYALYELTRKEAGIIGFDDMLLSAWEALIRYPELLELSQARFDCILVDEFQDVNAVQSEILDLMAQAHRNYMAIGDDDQTIYEWRGASTRFILNFPERYDAKTYVLSENFRSYASQLALANRVIVHNQQRRSKNLRLTRGFSGHSVVRKVEDEAAQAQQLVFDIMKACQSGYRFEQQAILLRLYAQSPFLEQGLIEAGIPYQIIGSQPFYRRSEIRILLAYLDLARLEQQIQTGHPLTATQLNRFHGRWMALANRPIRYLRRQQMDWVYEHVRRGESLLESLRSLMEQSDSKFKAKLLRKLIETLNWLIHTGLDLDAAACLKELEAQLEYCKYLRKSSGFPETGEGRAMTVEVILDYALGRGSTESFESHLEELQTQQRHDDAAVIMTTIFRAKGLEWPVVHVPHCNQGYLPYRSGHSLEEKRRLFYVAITRPREQLFLYSLNNHPISRFLKEAAYEETLDTVQSVQNAFDSEAQDFDVEALLKLARNQEGLVLRSYVERWWPASPQQRKALKNRVQALLNYAHKENLTRALSLSIQDIHEWEADAIQVQEKLAQAIELYLKSRPGPKTEPKPAENTVLDYAVGDRVWSEYFGEGEILALDRQNPQGELLEVSFSGHIHKLLSQYAGLQKSPR